MYSKELVVRNQPCYALDHEDALDMCRKVDGGGGKQARGGGKRERDYEPDTDFTHLPCQLRSLSQQLLHNNLLDPLVRLLPSY